MHSRVSIVRLGLIAALYCGPISAQEATPLSFSGGILGGFSATQVHGDATAGFNKLGLDAGVFLDVRDPGAYWGVRIEMRYIQKGSRKPHNPDAGDFTTWTRKLDYVELPVMLDVNLGRYQVGAGLYGGWLLRAEKIDSGVSFDVRNEFRSWDIGGLWYGRTHISDHAFVQMRMSGSILSIRDTDGVVGGLFRQRMRNIVAQLGLGWDFGGSVGSRGGGGAAFSL